MRRWFAWDMRLAVEGDRGLGGSCNMMDLGEGCSLPRQTSTVIIGGGIAGCAAAQELQARGIEYLLLEKNVEPGGLCRSISVGDGHFDYTGHYLHLARWRSPAAIPRAHQDDDHWQTVERRSAVYVDGHLTPAPFQYNLHALPDATRMSCIEGFRKRVLCERPLSFKEYLLSGFGKGICDTFLVPYNTKQLAISLDELSVDAVKRFFPYPDRDKIESGCIGKEAGSSVGYNSTFWYPKNSGIGLLAEGLSSDLMGLRTCCAAESIDLSRKRVLTSQGEIHYEHLITSIPLDAFCEKTADEELRALGRMLSHNQVLCVNLLLRGTLPEEVRDYHWVYLADSHVPCYRMGVYSSIPTEFRLVDYTSMYMEVAYPHTVALPSVHSILGDLWDVLERLAWARRENCHVLSMNWIECAYVHFKHDRQSTVDRIFEYLRNHSVYPIGRYGRWDYLSMEDSILSGITVVQELANDL